MITSVLIHMLNAASHDFWPFEMIACHLRDANWIKARGGQFTQTSLTPGKERHGKERHH